MKDYRKKYINDETDKEFVKTFFKEAKKDPITGEIGKTIFFVFLKLNVGILFY